MTIKINDVNKRRDEIKNVKENPNKIKNNIDILKIKKTNINSKHQ
jgi:hypothetical protein